VGPAYMLVGLGHTEFLTVSHGSGSFWCVRRRNVMRLRIYRNTETDVGQFRSEYLGEYEAISETISTRVNQGPIGGVNSWKKTEG
jgi:hypothetical protein